MTTPDAGDAELMPENGRPQCRKKGRSRTLASLHPALRAIHAVVNCDLQKTASPPITSLEGSRSGTVAFPWVSTSSSNLCILQVQILNVQTTTAPPRHDWTILPPDSLLNRCLWEPWHLTRLCSGIKAEKREPLAHQQAWVSTTCQGKVKGSSVRMRREIRGTP